MSVTSPGDDTATCPRCASALMRASEDNALSCLGCRGMFIRRAFLETALAEHAALGGPASYRTAAKAFEAPSNPRGSGAYEPDFVYLACPVCRRTMNRQNFMRRSGVIVDQCLDHGTWFDRGELERAAAFVASGWRPPTDETSARFPQKERALSGTAALLEMLRR